MCKKLMALMLVCAMVCMPGCGKKEKEQEADKEEQSAVAESIFDEETDEVIEGDRIQESENSSTVPDGPPSDSKDSEGSGLVEPPAPNTGNSGTAGSSGSGNSGNAGSSSGSGNSGNAGSSGSGNSGNTDSGSGSNTGGNTDSGSQSMNYESFQDMAPAQQQAYMESFDSIDAFFEWYNAAKEQYEKDHPSIEVGGNGSVDLDEVINGN